MKTQAAQYKTQNGEDLSYEEYCTLLMSAAQEYDGSLVRNVKAAPSAARRSVYHSEVDPHMDEDVYFDSPHNIDSSYNDVLDVNFSAFIGASLNADQWSRLSKEAQAKWDEFGQDTKSIILEHKLRPPLVTRLDPPGATLSTRLGPPGAILGSPLETVLSSSPAPVIQPSTCTT